MEMIEQVDGREQAMAYLDNWYSEEPDDLYLIGTYIDQYCWHDEEDRALELAEKYLHQDMKHDYELWFYDAVENLYDKLGMSEKSGEVDRIRTRQESRLWKMRREQS